MTHLYTKVGEDHVHIIIQSMGPIPEPARSDAADVMCNKWHVDCVLSHAI